MPESTDVLDDLLTRLAGPRLLDHLVDLDEVLCRHTIDDAEARVEARVRLYRHLLGAGWQAPAPVLAQLERDELLLGWQPAATA